MIRPRRVHLTPAGATQNWTFYGTAGESITVQLNPGAGGTNPAIAPYLNWGQVSLRNAGGNTLATASSASSGAFATIAGFTLPASGSYTIQVAAPAAQSTSTGNYVLSAYDVTPSVTLLSVNQEYTGTISNPFSVYRYQFTGAAGQQIQLQVIGASGGSEFDLTGPGSYTAFTNQQTNSSLITLPSSGPYVLTAHGNGSSGGSYAFKVVQTSVSPLTLGTPLSGQTFSASGQALLYAVTVPSTQSLQITLHDAAPQDVDQLYAKLGSPPTLVDYSASSSTGSANPQLLVPAAAPGTWYILAYGASVPAASSFTITATGTPIQLTAVAPTQAPAGTTATLVLTGSGFNSGTTVSLLPTAGSPHAASSVILDTFTQLTATFDLTGVPQGVYSVVASNPGGSSSELSAKFTVTAKGGMGMLDTHLILPAKMGRHISSTIEVEYSNVGTAAIAAPLLVLESARPQDVPLLTLDPSLVVSGYWTSATPVGYSSSVEILASGNQVPGWIEPGESVTVPVYYAGMQRPWDLSETNFQFNLLIYTQKDQKLNDWSSVESGLQPPGVSTQAWSAIFAGLQNEIGPTIGDYVTMLDNEATYLGQLGQNVTNVGQLWSLAVMQANGLTPSPVLANVDDLHVAVPGQIGLDFVRSYAEPTSSRDQLGPLGYGWTDNWQYSLSAAADGTVTVTLPTGQQRIFQPDSRGSDYFATPGDHGILTKGSGGTFVLQETNGQVESFNADGTLNYIQDSNGNRITAGYTSGRLTSLKASNGDPATNPVVASLTIGYNAAGLIGSVQSSDGRTVTYNYDPGKHLIGVTSFDGEVTQYGYQEDRVRRSRTRWSRSNTPMARRTTSATIRWAGFRRRRRPAARVR